MAQREERRRAAYRKRLQNRTSMMLIILIIVALLVIIGVNSYGLSQEREKLLAQKAANEELIKEEQEEALEIEEYQKYTKTLQYYEEMAKKKLGLVYEDEIIFVPED